MNLQTHTSKTVLSGRAHVNTTRYKFATRLGISDFCTPIVHAYQAPFITDSGNATPLAYQRQHLHFSEL